MDEFDQPYEKIANAMLQLGMNASAQRIAKETGIAVARIEAIVSKVDFWKTVKRQAKILAFTPTRMMQVNRAIHKNFFDESHRRYKPSYLRGLDEEQYGEALRVVDRMGKIARQQMLNEQMAATISSEGREDDMTSRELLEEMLQTEEGRELLQDLIEDGNEDAKALLELHGTIHIDDIPSVLAPIVDAAEDGYVIDGEVEEVDE